MAASLVVMLPVIVVFIAFQRYFIEGVTLRGRLEIAEPSVTMSRLVKKCTR